jgi:hypothetical protein
MTLDEIFDEWKQDAAIDPTQLGNSSLDIAKLHHKYYKMFSREKLLLKKMETDMKTLKFEKQEWYVQGPTKEGMDKGWRMPPKGKILKADVKEYIDSDPDVIEYFLKMAYQQEKIDLLESIIKTLSQRGWQIKTALDWEKFRVNEI